jgi:methionyl-tRNA formyltransferase
VLADYGQIVPRPLLDLSLGALNLHPSLLPRHRGATPIPATILAGDEETGVTLFRMDEGLDTGPILAQRRVALAGDETAESLHATLASEAAGLLEEQLGPWVRGEIEPRQQPAEGATLTRPLRREHGRLDPTLGAVRLERQIRALRPWPGSFLDLPSGRLIVWEAEPLALDGLPRLPAGGVLPGTLLPDNGGLALAVGDGALRLRRVQPAGGRPMAAEELRRGRPSLVGSRASNGTAEGQAELSR